MRKSKNFCQKKVKMKYENLFFVRKIECVKTTTTKKEWNKIESMYEKILSNETCLCVYESGIWWGNRCANIIFFSGKIRTICKIYNLKYVKCSIRLWKHTQHKTIKWACMLALSFHFRSHRIRVSWYTFCCAWWEKNRFIEKAWAKIWFVAHWFFFKKKIIKNRQNNGIRNKYTISTKIKDRRFRFRSMENLNSTHSKRNCFLVVFLFFLYMQWTRPNVLFYNLVILTTKSILNCCRNCMKFKRKHVLDNF